MVNYCSLKKGSLCYKNLPLHMRCFSACTCTTQHTFIHNWHISHTIPSHTHTLTHTHPHTHIPPPSPPSTTQTHTQHLNEQIAHLKDQLQELKAKTNLEAKYVKKETQVGIIPSKVYCLQSNFTLCKYPNSMIEYGGVWWSMIEYSRVWWSMVEYGRVW